MRDYTERLDSIQAAYDDRLNLFWLHSDYYSKTEEKKADHRRLLEGLIKRFEGYYLELQTDLYFHVRIPDDLESGIDGFIKQMRHRLDDLERMENIDNHRRVKTIKEKIKKRYPEFYSKWDELYDDFFDIRDNKINWLKHKNSLAYLLRWIDYSNETEMESDFIVDCFLIRNTPITKKSYDSFHKSGFNKLGKNAQKELKTIFPKLV